MKLEFEAQPRALRVHEVGHAGVRHLRRRAAGFGIVHQVNLEYLARGVHRGAGRPCYPDTLVGTDSHTTMINGIGVVGWGVGGIEAEAAMLGQPVYFLTPDVVGFELTGRLREASPPPTWCSPSPRCCAGEGGGQVRRVLRRGHKACRAGPRHHRQHGARSTARRWASSRSTSGPSTTSNRRHRAQPRRDRGRSRPTSKAQACSASRAPGEIDYRGRAARPRHGAEPRRGPEAPAGPHRDRPTSGQVHAAVQRKAGGQRLQPAGGAKLDRAGFTTAQRIDVRQRRRADRRHHLVHQHQQPERAAGRRPAGEEGGRGGLSVPGHIKTSLAPGSRRHRLPQQGRPAARSRSWASTSPSATAAPPASATPATWRPRSTRRSRENDLVVRRVLSATATSRRASTPT